MSFNISYDDDKKKEYFGRFLGNIITFTLKVFRIPDEIAQTAGEEIGGFLSGITVEKVEADSLEAHWNKVLDNTWKKMEKKYDFPEEFWFPLKSKLFRTAQSIIEIIQLRNSTASSNRINANYQLIDCFDQIIDKTFANSPLFDSMLIPKSFSMDLLLLLDETIHDDISIENRFYIIDLMREKQNVLTTEKVNEKLSILATTAPPCEPFIQDNVRSNDLEIIKSILDSSNKPLILFGECGIGKTELIFYFAEKYRDEYDFVFIKFKGSIVQTLSQKLFALKHNNLAPPSDEDKYDHNVALLKHYNDLLRNYGKRLVLVIDNYDTLQYEKKFSEMMGLEFDSGYSGSENDLHTIRSLLLTGIKIIITTRTTPSSSDFFSTHEVKKMSEESLVKLISIHFSKIQPFLDKDIVLNGKEESNGRQITDLNVLEKLKYLVKASEYNTGFLTFISLSMQADERNPLIVLNKMCDDLLDSDKEYLTRYSGVSTKLQLHIEKVLHFEELSFQSKQVLSTLIMLPDEGIEYEIYRKILMQNGAEQLYRIREKIIERFINNHVALLEVKGSKSIAYCNDRQLDIENRVLLENSFPSPKIIRMNSFISHYVLRVYYDKDRSGFLGALFLNWIGNLLFLCNENTIDKLVNKDDQKMVETIANACSSADLKLSLLGNMETINDLRHDLLFNAAEISIKCGNMKDGIEYIERAMNVDGPTWNDMQKLVYYLHQAGMVYYHGGKYATAKRYMNNALSILNDRNNITMDDLFSDSFLSVLSEMDDLDSYGAILGNLSTIYREMNNFDKALQSCEMSIEIQKHVDGEDNVDLASAYIIRASLYVDQKDYKDALAICEKAIEIMEKKIESHHLFVANAYTVKAIILRELNNDNEAMKCCDLALSIYSHINHAEEAKAFCLKASIYEKNQQYKNALSNYTIALDISKNLYGDYHPNTMTIYKKVAQMLSYFDNKELEALDAYIHFFDIREKTYDELHDVQGENGHDETINWKKEDFQMFREKLGNLYELINKKISNSDV